MPKPKSKPSRRLQEQPEETEQKRQQEIVDRALELELDEDVPPAIACTRAEQEVNEKYAAQAVEKHDRQNRIDLAKKEKWETILVMLKKAIDTAMYPVYDDLREVNSCVNWVNHHLRGTEYARLLADLRQSMNCALEIVDQLPSKINRAERNLPTLPSSHECLKQEMVDSVEQCRSRTTEYARLCEERLKTIDELMNKQIARSVLIDIIADATTIAVRKPANDAMWAYINAQVAIGLSADEFYERISHQLYLIKEEFFKDIWETRRWQAYLGIGRGYLTREQAANDDSYTERCERDHADATWYIPRPSDEHSPQVRALLAGYWEIVERKEREERELDEEVNRMEEVAREYAMARNLCSACVSGIDHMCYCGM